MNDFLYNIIKVNLIIFDVIGGLLLIYALKKLPFTKPTRKIIIVLSFLLIISSLFMMTFY